MKYVLLHPRVMIEALELLEPLVVRFVHLEPGSEAVLLDALMEAGAVALPKWNRTLLTASPTRFGAQPGSAVYAVGGGRIHQSVNIAGGRSVRWEIIPLHSRERRRRFASHAAAERFIHNANPTYDFYVGTYEVTRPQRRGWRELDATARIRRARRKARS